MITKFIYVIIKLETPSIARTYYTEHETAIKNNIKFLIAVNYALQFDTYEDAQAKLDLLPIEKEPTYYQIEKIYIKS